MSFPIPSSTRLSLPRCDDSGRTNRSAPSRWAITFRSASGITRFRPRAKTSRLSTSMLRPTSRPAAHARHAPLRHLEPLSRHRCCPRHRLGARTLLSEPQREVWSSSNTSGKDVRRRALIVQMSVFVSVGSMELTNPQADASACGIERAAFRDFPNPPAHHPLPVL